MKKIFKYLFMFLAITTGALVMSSCSKDDDDKNDKPSTEEQSVTNPIVGTKWIAEKGKYLYFKTQTTGIYYEGDSYDNGDPYEDFSYTFNPKDNTILLLFGDEYESAQYTSSYIICGNRKYYKE